VPRPKGLPKTGGKKKGSKHKKTIAQEQALEFLREKIRRDFDELYEAKIALAKGVYIIKPVEDNLGKVINAKAFKEKPDGQSIEYLFSLVVGKPKEKMDVDVKSSDIEKLALAIKKLADEKQITGISGKTLSE
jgi:hypothetical protein